MGAHLPAMARLIFPALLGWVAGNAIQVQQAQLQSWLLYLGLVLAALLLWALSLVKKASLGWRRVLMLISFGMLAFGTTGLRAGVFLADALDPTLDKGIGLKWPNDLMLTPRDKPRKLGGILIETVLRQGDAAQARFAVIGIGLNLATPPAADYRTEPAGLRELLGSQTTAHDLLLQILPGLVQGLNRFCANGFASFTNEFARRDVLLGKPLQLSDGNRGRAAGVDDQGVLWLDSDNGRIPVSSDEVRIADAGAA